MRKAVESSKFQETIPPIGGTNKLEIVKSNIQSGFPDVFSVF
jgi:hypothetical protein